MIRVMAIAVMEHSASRTAAFASGNGSDGLGLLVPIQKDVISRCAKAE